MAESFFERRKRERGLTGGSVQSSATKTSDGNEISFFEQRKMERGLIADTRPKPVVPVSKPLTADQFITGSNRAVAGIRNFTKQGEARQAEQKKQAEVKKADQKKKASSAPKFLKWGHDISEKVDDLIFGDSLGTGNRKPMRPVLQQVGDFHDRTRLDIPGTKIDNSIGNFVQGAGDAATFGASTWMNRQMDRQEVADGATETTAGKVGQVAGTLIPGGAAWKLGGTAVRGIGNSALRTGLRGAIGGAAYGTGREIGEAGFGVNDQSLGGRAKDVGLDAAFGAGGDLLLSGAGNALKGVAQRAASGITKRTLGSFNAVEQVGRESSLVDNAVSRISSIDEEIGSLSSRPNKSGSYTDELSALVNERKQAVDYVKQLDPEFDSPNPRVTAGSDPNALRPISAGPAVNAGQQSANLSSRQAAMQGIRGNYGNQLNNGNFSDELNQAIRNTDQTYDIARNADSVAKANENVKNLTKAEADFIANESGGPDHVATGYRLMQELDALGEHQRALNIADKLAKDLTKSGQTSQAASLLSRLSPEGQLLNLTRTAARNGREVSVADSVKFKQLASEVQQNSGAGIRENQINGILQRMENGEKVTADDLKTLGSFLDRANKVIKPKSAQVKDDLPKEFKDVKKRDKIVSFLDNAEQAALARIQARKTRLNALPVDEWTDHAIVVAAQIGRGTIKAATHVEDLVKMFGEEIRPVASEVFKKAYGLVRGVSQKAAEGKLHEANNAFKRITGQNNLTLQEKIVEKYIKDNPVSQPDITKLRELAKQVSALSGDKSVNADMAMQQILNSYEKSSAWDKIQAIRYIAMLLNSGTQAINALSGPAMATTGYVADVFGTMVDIAISKTLRQPRTTTLYGTNPLKFVARWFKGAKVGGKAGALGVNPSGIAGPNEIRGLTYKSLYNPLGLAERGLGAVAKGADYGTYSAVQKSEMQKIAFLDAKNNRIKGRDNIKKHIEAFLNDPPPEAILQADRIGKNTTFQRNDSFGGKAANFLHSTPWQLKPVTGAIFPFVRTPVNIASTAVTLTPGGIIKGLYQLTGKSDASRREAIRTLSLGLTGTGMSALGYYLSQLGIITGSNDSGNKDVDALRDQVGEGKYRFNTSSLTRYLKAMVNGEGSAAAEKAAKFQKGDKQFDYNKLQPLAFPLAIGAGLEGNKEKGVTESLQGAGTDAYGSLYGMSTLKGVQDVFQPSYGGSMGEKALGTPVRIIESFLKSFSPSAMGQEARRQDPIQRKTSYNNGIKKDVTDYFKSRTPGLSQSLPPSKTTLGQNKLNAPGIAGQYLNPYKSDVAPYNEAAVVVARLIDSTGNQGLAPKAPEKKVEGKDHSGNQVSVSIPQARYAKLQEDIGNEIATRILDIPTDWSDERQAKKVESIYTSVRKREMNKVKREFGIRVSL
jgi:hypothetical protein